MAANVAATLRRCQLERERRRTRTFHHAISGVITTVGNIQGTQTGSISTFTTVTAVIVAMVPAIIFVRCRETRRGPLG